MVKRAAATLHTRVLLSAAAEKVLSRCMRACVLEEGSQRLGEVCIGAVLRALGCVVPHGPAGVRLEEQIKTPQVRGANAGRDGSRMPHASQSTTAAWGTRQGKAGEAGGVQILMYSQIDGVGGEVEICIE